MLSNFVRFGAVACAALGYALPAAERPVVLTNGLLVSGGQIYADRTLVIERDRIAYIGEARPYLPPGAQWVDLSGAYIALQNAPAGAHIVPGAPAELVVLADNPLESGAPIVRAALVGGRMVNYLGP